MKQQKDKTMGIAAAGTYKLHIYTLNCFNA